MSEPAFPFVKVHPTDGWKHDVRYSGLTKREWFAGMALMGLVKFMPDNGEDPNLVDTVIDRAAYLAGCYADSLISELQDGEEMYSINENGSILSEIKS